MKTINSYGIACIRKRREYEILMVRRKCTYAFLQFIMGRYKSRFEVQSLFSHMTIIEKNIISAGNFEIAYFHAFSVSKATALSTNLCGNYLKLEKTFYSIRPEKIQSFIEGSPYGKLSWQFPKGRKNESENDLQSAMREFEEETGVKHYSILLNTDPFVLNISDCGVRYKYVIYLAIGDEDPVYDSNYLNPEVSEIEWIPASAAAFYVDSETLKVFKAIIKEIKKQKEIIDEAKFKIDNRECTATKGL